jgi:hypothetical protein
MIVLAETNSWAKVGAACRLVQTAYQLHTTLLEHGDGGEMELLPEKLDLPLKSSMMSGSHGTGTLPVKEVGTPSSQSGGLISPIPFLEHHLRNNKCHSSDTPTRFAVIVKRGITLRLRTRVSGSNARARKPTKGRDYSPSFDSTRPRLLPGLVAAEVGNGRRRLATV